MLVKGIVVHCSDSSFGNAQMIEDWHKERGWNDIGYHVTISNGQITKDNHVKFMDGSIEIGRDWSKAGAHAKGYNDHLGICLIGINDFTTKQFNSLVEVCLELMETYNLKVSDVIGHYECKNSGKTCPNFDVEELRSMLAAKKDEWNG